MILEKAIEFVKLNSEDLYDKVRLEYILFNKIPNEEQLNNIISTQRFDGGWSPFWAVGESSVDATCYRLALIEQAGVKQHRVIDNAVEFLFKRLNNGCYFEEDISLVNVCPPWAMPGDLESRLYLTSNCSFWIKHFTTNLDEQIVSYLVDHIDDTGHIKSYLHTKWLTAGLLFQMGYEEKANLIFRSLLNDYTEMSADNLAWMINTLMIAGVNKDENLIKNAGKRLIDMQQEDGSWISDDGSWRNVHTTLESIRALDFVCN